MSTTHNRTRRSSVAHQSGGRTADTSIRNGRRRAQSVAVTRREREANPRDLELGERAEQGNTSGATKVRHTIGDRTEAFFKQDQHTLNIPEGKENWPLAWADIPTTNPRLGERGVASYLLGLELIGINVVPLPRTYMGEIEGQYGHISLKAPGTEITKLRKREYNQGIITPEFVTDILNLQVLDYISGQTDRNLSNIFVEEKGGKFTRVFGIDNDISFGPGRELANNGSFFPQLPFPIPENTRSSLREKGEGVIRKLMEKRLITNIEAREARRRLIYLLDHSSSINGIREDSLPQDIEGFKALGPYFKNVANELFSHISPAANDDAIGEVESLASDDDAIGEVESLASDDDAIGEAESLASDDDIGRQELFNQFIGRIPIEPQQPIPARRLRGNLGRLRQAIQGQPNEIEEDINRISPAIVNIPLPNDDQPDPLLEEGRQPRRRGNLGRLEEALPPQRRRRANNLGGATQIDLDEMPPPQVVPLPPPEENQLSPLHDLPRVRREAAPGAPGRPQ